jgi:hypothetical protein
LGLNQICYGFGLVQGELAIQIGSESEFPRSGHPRAFLHTQLQSPAENIQATVTGDLYHFFPGIGVRGGEMEEEGLIQGAIAVVERA